MVITEHFKSPATWIAIIGAVLTWVGAIINWHQDSTSALKPVLGVLFSFQIYFDTLPVFIPIFTLCGLVRRSPQLYAIAMGFFTASFCYLTFLAHFNLKANSQAMTLHFGGLVAELLGMCLSLAPIVSKFNGTIPGSLVNVCCALCWTVTTAVFGHLAKGRMFYIITSSTSASFIIWHAVAGFSGLTSVTVALVAVELWTLTKFVTELPAGSANANLGAAMPFVATFIHLAWVSYHFAKKPVYDLLKRQEDVLDDVTGEEMVNLGLDTEATPNYSFSSNPGRGAYSFSGLIIMGVGCVMNWYWDASGKLMNNSTVLMTVMALLVPILTIIASVRIAPQLNAIANFAFLAVTPGLCSNAYVMKKLATPFFSRYTPIEYRIRAAGLFLILAGLALAMCSILRFTTDKPRRRPIFLAAPAAVAWIAAGIVNATIQVTYTTTPISFGVIGIGLGLWCMYASIWSSTSSTVVLASAELIFSIMWMLLIGSMGGVSPTSAQKAAGWMAIIATVLHLGGLLVDFSLTRIRETPKKSSRNAYQLIN